MRGHIAKACPDLWRRYHLTVRIERKYRREKNCIVSTININRNTTFDEQITKNSTAVIIK